MSKEYIQENYKEMTPSVRNIAFEEKREKRMNEFRKRYANNQSLSEMNQVIIGLIYQGKDLDQIKSIVIKKFPEVTKKMIDRLIQLPDGTEIDVLEAQIKEKIERFKRKGSIKLGKAELIY